MKKRLFLLLFTGSLIINSYSQNDVCNCKSSLTFLDSKIRKTPAYKVNKKAYNTSYSDISKEAKSSSTIFDCHVLLNKLLIALNDNHSKVYGLELGATNDVTSNSEKFNAFKQTELFNAYPKPNINLDSLTNVLNSKAKTDIEGIYHMDNYMTIGVYRTQNNYQAIVLDSVSDVWRVGEIIYVLIPFGNDYLLSIGGSITSKRLIAYTERLENGFFHFMGFQKDLSQINYSTKTLSDSTYYRKELSDKLTYIKIGSFNSWNPTLSEAEKFYKSLEGNLNKPNLIVDLRNNGGGGERNSNILYKLLKDYSKKNRIYVLVNHRTVSNAEQFTKKLSTLENSQIFGTRTNGTLAYEIKDSSYNLPCGNFVAVLTSKKHSDYLEFESNGIEPDVTLNADDDWIVQLNNHILKNNKD